MNQDEILQRALHKSGLYEKLKMEKAFFFKLQGEDFTKAEVVYTEDIPDEMKLLGDMLSSAKEEMIILEKENQVLKLRVEELESRSFWKRVFNK